MDQNESEYAVLENLFLKINSMLGPSIQSQRYCSLLLSGASGSGKTVLARLIADANNLHFIETDCFDLWSEVAGSSEARIRHAFTEASKQQPVLMCLKNVEIMGKDAQSDDFDPRVTASFTSCLRKIKHTKYENDQQLDSFVLIATTSNKKAINGNVIQEFFYHFEIQNPDDKGRHKLFQLLLCKNSRVDVNDIDLEHIVKHTAGFLLSDIKYLVSLAIVKALQRSSNDHWDNLQSKKCHDYKITNEDFLSALKSVRSDLSTSLGTPLIPDVKWDDVGGLNEAKTYIQDMVCMNVYPALLSGNLRRSGVLLYGPPGCGKTLLAKAVANECQLNFLSVKGPELLSMYVGQSERNVTALFIKARQASPCIIFFDEVDALAPNRGRSGDSGGVMDRLVSQLLAEMDGLDGDDCGGVFVIAATNRPDLVDPALLRPGRLDRCLAVDVCQDEQSKLSVLQAATRRTPLAPSVDLAVVARAAPLRSTGADFQALVADACAAAVRRIAHSAGLAKRTASKTIVKNMTTESGIENDDNLMSSDEDLAASLASECFVEQQDFLLALDSMKCSLADSDISDYEATKRRIQT